MNIFEADEDFVFFLYLLKKYLEPNFKEKRQFKGEQIELPVNSVYDQCCLYCYCLMPNHFHLLLKNIKSNGLSNLTKRVLSVYTVYFNQKYEREGPLIQGGYRAVRVISNEQLIHVSRYIHLNPLKSRIVSDISNYKFSSYFSYLNRSVSKWLNLEPEILEATDYANIGKYLEEIHEDSKIGYIL